MVTLQAGTLVTGIKEWRRLQLGKCVRWTVQGNSDICHRCAQPPNQSMCSVTWRGSAGAVLPGGEVHLRYLVLARPAARLPRQLHGVPGQWSATHNTGVKYPAHKTKEGKCYTHYWQVSSHTDWPPSPGLPLPALPHQPPLPSYHTLLVVVTQAQQTAPVSGVHSIVSLWP